MPIATIRTARPTVVIPSALPQVTWCEDCTFEVEARKAAGRGGQTLVYLATTTRHTPEGLVKVCDLHASWHDELAADDLFGTDTDTDIAAADDEFAATVIKDELVLDDMLAIVEAVLDETRTNAWGVAA